MAKSASEISRRLRISAETHRRSEEHTSELQSRLHLVCCLLLEKKRRGGRSLRPVTAAPLHPVARTDPPAEAHIRVHTAMEVALDAEAQGTRLPSGFFFSVGRPRGAPPLPPPASPRP